MDPLTAVSLGANVIQFLDFVTRLVSVGREIGESAHGATVENEELEAVTRSVVWLNGRVLDSMADVRSNAEHHNVGSATASSAIPNMAFLASACNDVSAELLGALDKLKAGNKGRKWNGLVQAFKTIWTKGQIDSLRSRLDQYRSTMQSALMVSLRDEVHAINQQVLANLDPRSAVDNLKKDLLEYAKQSQGSGEGQDALNMAAFASKLSTMTKQERDTLFQSQILEQIGIEHKLDREHRIAVAHEKTFRWVFTNQHRQGHGDKRWSDFVSWLETDDDPLYWITRQGRIGKINPTKFIGHNPLCKAHLEAWAGELPMVVTRFYFWNSGGEEQQSQQGLLRSILYEALSQRPDEIPKVLGKRWNRCLLFGSDSRQWIQAELVEAFNNLVARAAGNFKLCMFVDGLDEFNGDHEELITLFKQAIGFPNVKVCLSSRPWVVFEDAFVHRPSLMLEHMTYPDILSFVSDRFNGNYGFITMQAREPQVASSLIENVAKKSCGVFLWVALVVKSLLGGLSNMDHISDLQRRLDELPSDLENFYEKILDSIDPFYAAHAGQLFSLVEAADGQLTVLGLAFADGKEYASLQQVLDVEVGGLSDGDMVYQLERTKRYLSSRCKGLLEVPMPDIYGQMEEEEEEPSWTADGDGDNSSVPPPQEIAPRPRIDKFYLTPINPPDQFRQSMQLMGGINDGGAMAETPGSHTESLLTKLKRGIPEPSHPTPQELKFSTPPAFRKVSYLHRTVRDFVQSPQIKDRIHKMMGEFTPYPGLLRSSVLMAKTWSLRHQTWNPLRDHVRQGLRYACEVEKAGNLQGELLDEMDRSVSSVVARDPECMAPKLATNHHWAARCETRVSVAMVTGFLELTARNHLFSYVSSKMFQNVAIFPNDPDRPLLHRIITEYRRYPAFCTPDLVEASPRRMVPSIALVQHQLASGGDPNFVVDGQTTWQELLRQCIAAGQGHPTSKLSPQDKGLAAEVEQWASIVELFIRAGADPRMNKNSQLGSCIREAFSWLPNDRSKKLEKLLSSSQRRWTLARRFAIPPLIRQAPDPEESVPITVSNRNDRARFPGRPAPWSNNFAGRQPLHDDDRLSRSSGGCKDKTFDFSRQGGGPPVS